jgi:hypothetical protein
LAGRQDDVRLEADFEKEVVMGSVVGMLLYNAFRDAMASLNVDVEEKWEDLDPDLEQKVWAKVAERAQQIFEAK